MNLSNGYLKRRYRVAQGLERGLGENREEEVSETFLGRMEAQCDEIRKYRQRVLSSEGRKLSYDEAALEWIELYAEVFAREHGAS